MLKKVSGQRCRIGIDVGGTFTDFVLTDLETGHLTFFKQPSVPADPSRSVELGIVKLLERAGLLPSDVELIVHGTTLLVNAIIQRRGAKVGLVVSKGNRGVLEIGRARLANSYDFTIRKEEPLVPRSLIFETTARLKADGTILEDTSESEIAEIAAKLRDAQVDSVAVMLLHSYAFPEMERKVAALLRRHLGKIPVTESAYVWPERREFERCLVAVMNAYVQPIMDSYLSLLTSRVKGVGIDAPIYITASNGGTLSIETARARPIDTILSGPASGVVAAAAAAAISGQKQIITVDMGGTSCDVSMTKGGEPEYTTLTHVGDFPLILPVVNVSAIGAGGGSIIWVDPQGVLKVGPRSAGADPGPVCYGLGGTEPTVTDCYLLVGYIDPKNFLGGRMSLDKAAATTALEKLADKVGIEGKDRAIKTAEAALRVTTAIMATELYKGLAQRGEDPRGFALMAFGGAGPTHANLLADEAQLNSIIVPPAPGTFCALGAILADVKRDYVRSKHLFLNEGRKAIADLTNIFRGLEKESKAWIKTEGKILGETTFVATADMRYAGQAFDLQVAIPDSLRVRPNVNDLSELFHRAHERIYSFRDLESGVEITTERVQVAGKMPGIALPKVPRRTAATPKSRRQVYHLGQYRNVPVYWRPDLGSGTTLSGPAIIEQEDSTTWVLPDWSLRVDSVGNMLLSNDRVQRRSVRTSTGAPKRAPKVKGKATPARKVAAKARNRPESAAKPKRAGTKRKA
jgi:N-methylhydantoinase A